MEDTNPVTMPLATMENLTKPDENAELLHDKPYAELIGSLMYTSTATQPDLMHAVSVLSQFTSSYELQHWLATKRVLQYIVGTVNNGIKYKKNYEELTGYSDADFANNEMDRKSLTGFVFLLGKGAITWNPVDIA